MEASIHKHPFPSIVKAMGGGGGGGGGGGHKLTFYHNVTFVTAVVAV